MLVTPHWGPNMLAEPLPAVRDAAAALVAAGATLVAGHSAQSSRASPGASSTTSVTSSTTTRSTATCATTSVSCGSSRSRTAPRRRLEALPLALGHCHTRLATGDDAAWVVRRLRELCARLGTEARHEEGRCVVSLS